MIAFPYIPRQNERDNGWTLGWTVPWLKGWTAERRRQRLRREAFNTLLRVDDNVLCDVMGLSRREVEELARLPLSVDAIEAAQRMREQ